MVWSRCKTGFPDLQDSVNINVVNMNFTRTEIFTLWGIIRKILIVVTYHKALPTYNLQLKTSGYIIPNSLFVTFSAHFSTSSTYVRVYDFRLSIASVDRSEAENRHLLVVQHGGRNHTVLCNIAMKMQVSFSYIFLCLFNVDIIKQKLNEL
jgi:hypothetical protein